MEKFAISGLLGQELAVVFKTFIHIAVSPETFITGIIIVVCSGTEPVVAFDAEMVVALDREVAPSGVALEQALCQCDAGGDVVFQHFGNGQVLILVDVGLINSIPLHLC